MTAPIYDSALHMMEGQGLLRDLHARIMNIPAEPGVLAKDYAAAYKTGHRDARHAAAELALTAIPKTSFFNWVDEVEASGEAEKHAYPALPEEVYLGGDEAFNDAVTGFTDVQMHAYVDADRAAMRYELNKFKTLYQLSQDGLTRERGITKELAAALEAAFEALASIDGAFQKERVMCFDALKKVKS